MNLKEKQQVVKIISQENPTGGKALFNLARREFGKFKKPLPAKSELLKIYRQLLKNKKIKINKNLERGLTKRAVRTLSGVAVISVLTKPRPCPGKCLYCPSEKAMPKSYLSNEPAVMRAIANKFDPYRQTRARLLALAANGHQTDKIELIVMGGTWSAHSPKYQTWFIKRCFEALNHKKTKSLIIAQKQSETAKHRCVGLTLETRPDYINEKEIKRMRQLGCTRVELGVQQITDQILKLNRRGHSVKQTSKAIALLKQAGFKINCHLMLNLPGATPAKDLAMFKKIYATENFKPDMVKIYPCVVVKNSALYRLWQNKKYKPYTDKQLLNLLIKIKKITPPFVRITRLIRDIPETSIVAGNKITNLRQLIQNQAKKEGWQCRCIRCREAGHQINDQKLKTKNYLPAQAGKLKTMRYRASGGTEYFLSYETKDGKILYAFLRLRINQNIDKNFIPELRGAALIRELHTYGQAAALGQAGEVQHLGLGKKLMAEAEKICQQNKIGKIAVIAGVGVREYYKKLGYELAGSYMIKSF